MATSCDFVAVAVAAAGRGPLLRLVGAERVRPRRARPRRPGQSHRAGPLAHVAVAARAVTAVSGVFGLGAWGSSARRRLPWRLPVGGAAVAVDACPRCWVVVGVAAAVLRRGPTVRALAWGVLLVAFVVGELGATMRLPVVGPRRLAVRAPLGAPGRLVRRSCPPWRSSSPPRSSRPGARPTGAATSTSPEAGPRPHLRPGTDSREVDAALLLELLDDPLDVLGALERRHEHGVAGVDDDDVLETDDRHRPSAPRRDETGRSRPP